MKREDECNRTLLDLKDAKLTAFTDYTVLVIILIKLGAWKNVKENLQHY
jgi:hypothetical protein